MAFVTVKWNPRRRGRQLAPPRWTTETDRAEVIGANLLTNSRMTCAKTCLKKHEWRYELGIVPDVEAKPLRMGKAMHRGIELRAKGAAAGEATAAVLADYDHYPTPEDPDKAFDFAIERVTIGCLLNGYFWRWDETMPLEHLATEQAFELPIVNTETGGLCRNFRVAGVMDGVVKAPDGRVLVKECKTTSDDLAPDSDYWARLRIDQQISLYFRAAEQLGYKPESVLYDVIRKPSIEPILIPTLDSDGFKIVLDDAGQRVYLANGKPRQAGDKEKGWTLQSRRQTPEEYGERLAADIGERPDWYFQRKEIPRLAVDLEEFDAELWMMQGMLRDCQRLGRWPRNTSACIGFGKCPYFQLCTQGWKPGQGLDLPPGYVRTNELHPELGDRA
jgi:hypothetical protein